MGRGSVCVAIVAPPVECVSGCLVVLGSVIGGCIVAGLGLGIGIIFGLVISARRVFARAVEKSLLSEANSMVTYNENTFSVSVSLKALSKLKVHRYFHLLLMKKLKRNLYICTKLHMDSTSPN